MAIYVISQKGQLEVISYRSCLIEHYFLDGAYQGIENYIRIIIVHFFSFSEIFLLQFLRPLPHKQQTADHQL